MSQIQRYRQFSKEEFEAALRVTSKFMEFPESWYETEWLEDEQGKYRSRRLKNKIKEHCYIVPFTFNPSRILKVYSSVKRRTGISRDAGGDAIRVVLADIQGEPKHVAYKRINRTGNWRINLRVRISEVLASAGFNIICPICKRDTLFLKWNRQDKSRFLGCSEWPECKGTRVFDDGF